MLNPSLEYYIQFSINFVDQNSVLYQDIAKWISNSSLPAYLRKEFGSNIQLLLILVSKFVQWHTPHSIKLWNHYSDLCWTCQQNSATMVRAVSKPDLEKSATIKASQDHLLLVQLEWSFNDCYYWMIFYTTTCDSCHQQIVSHCSSHDNLTLLLLIVTYQKIQLTLQHITVLIMPSKCIMLAVLRANVFPTPNKRSIFGVDCEGISRQIMRPSIVGKVLMWQLISCITFSCTTDWEKRKFFFTLSIALVRTWITILFNTCCGDVWHSDRQQHITILSTTHNYSLNYAIIHVLFKFH